MKALWSKSTWLKDVHRVYATDEQNLRWASLDNKSALEAGTKALKGEQDRPNHWLNLITTSVKPMYEILAQRDDLMKEVQLRVLDQLKSGRLTSFGFEAPRRHADAPIELPLEIWQGQVHWDISQIAFQSMSFVDIRLNSGWSSVMLEMDSSNASVLEHKPMPLEVKRQGRPTIANELRTCFEFHVATDQIDGLKSFASHFEMFRSWLKQNCPALPCDASSISENTFRLHLSQEFNAIKLEAKADKSKTQKP